MAQRAPRHYLRPNDKVWTPPHVAFLDSETRTRMAGDVEILELRLWVAKLIDRRNQRKTSPAVQVERGRTSGELADVMEGWARGRKSLWVYAHNLSFDLVTTGLPVIMNRRGWAITDFALRSHSPWLRLSNGRTAITLVDSWSWLQAPLASVAAQYGRAKEPLPDNDGPDVEWWARCEVDVDLLAQAMVDLMDWWDRNRLGRWTISGAAAGWNAYRHRGGPWRVCVDPDPAVLAEDRLAVRGGRRDAQRVGDLGRGSFVEVDFTAAHATVCANLPLPLNRGGTFNSLPPDHEAITSDRWGVVAEVTISTETPRYPMRYGGVTWYPVGTFKTHLASPEIAWARDNGDLVEIGPGRFHQLGWALQDFASWILRVCAGEEEDSPPVAKMAAKFWGRAVPGKFASRGQEKVVLGPSPTDGWGYMDGWDHEQGRHGAMVDIGGQRYWTIYGTEGENTYPAVLAWVESYERVRLGRLLEIFPEGTWISCDTDGATIDMTAAASWAKGLVDFSKIPRTGWAVAQALCDLSAEATAPLVARPKKEHGTMRLLGAQHVITDQERKLSGIRSDAQETGPWAFQARDWPSLRWQMARSNLGEYRRPVRSPKLVRPLVHRWITADGEAWPVVAYIDQDGNNAIHRWMDTWGPHVSSGLEGPQYQGLDGLY